MDLSFYKILVAEDNQVNQVIMGKMLDKIGVQYTLVDSGQQVLDTLMNERFDLVVLDCYMRTMTGFETAENIRASTESFRNVPILAFTASSSPQDRILCQNSGMNDFIPKPATTEQLKEKLAEWASKTYEALPVLDASSIDKIRMFDDQDQTLLKSILQIYSEITKDELEQMGQLIAAADLEGVRKKAHKLKSSAAQLGAFRFEKFCNLTEYDRNLTQERAQKLHAEMLKEYESSRNKLAQNCQNYSQI